MVSLSQRVVALTDMRILRCSGLAFFTCVVLSAACSGRLTVLSGTPDGGIGDGDPSGGTGAGAGSGGASGGTGGSGDTGGSTGSGGVTSGSGGSTTTTGSGGSGPGGTGGASGSGGSTTTTGSGGSETTGSGGSGPGGSGGISGSGAAGAAGSAGSGGGISTDSGSCGCVTGHIDWGMDGGHVTYHDTSALEVCNLFVHQRTAVAPGPPVLFCEQQITDCAGVFGPGDVTRALAHADVRAAVGAAPVLYGEDTRPADGQVLRIQIGTAIVEVGNPCNKDGCKPIPAGVDALANLLRSVTKQELARSPCSTTFPPPAD